MGIYRHIKGKVTLWACENTLVGKHCGIKLSDGNWNKTDDSAFVERTKQALDLIQSLDPKRFVCIQRHINYVCNVELYSGGKYCSGNVCLIDFGYYNFSQHPEWSLYMLSAVLVHEAPHGLLRAKGIKRTKRNWVQIERICRAEENRFLSRIDSPWGDQLRKPFDPADWDYGSWLTRAMTLFRRIGEERKKAQHPPSSQTESSASPETES